MESSIVRKNVIAAMERARRRAAERRAKTDQASKAFESFLQNTAAPLFRQIASVLKAEGYAFGVFTPSGSVRLMSDKSAEDYIEIALDTASEAPRVVAHVMRSRGRRVVESEHIVASGDPESITEDDLLAFLLKEIEPFVER